MRFYKLLVSLLLSQAVASPASYDNEDAYGQAPAGISMSNVTVNADGLASVIGASAGVQFAVDEAWLADVDRGAVIVHIPITVKVPNPMIAWAEAYINVTSEHQPPAERAPGTGSFDKRGAEDAEGIAWLIKQMRLKPKDVYPFVGVIVYATYPHRIWKRYITTTTTGREVPNRTLQVFIQVVRVLLFFVQLELCLQWQYVESAVWRYTVGLVSFVGPTIVISMVDNLFLIKEEDESVSDDIPLGDMSSSPN